MAASKSAGGKKASASASASTAKITSEESTPTKKDEAQAGPLSPGASPDVDMKPSRRGRGILMPFVLLAAFAAGGVAGGHAVGNILETEYQDIVSRLRADHHIALTRSRSDILDCQSKLADEKRNGEGELSRLRIQADRNERAFQKKAEQYLRETNSAYTVANEGLEKASARLKAEADGHESTKAQLSAARQKLRDVVDEHDQARDNLSEELRVAVKENEYQRTEIQSIRAALTQVREESERLLREREEATRKLERLEGELDEAYEDLDRRELERAECDEHHRNMLECRESLKAALVDLADAEERATAAAADSPSAAPPREQHNESQAAAELALAREENDELSKQLAQFRKQGSEQIGAMGRRLDEAMKEKERMEGEVKALRTRAAREAAGDDGALREMETRLAEAEAEWGRWERKFKSIQEKVMFRDRREVLDSFGPGPHHVKMTFKFATQPELESVILELAPLNFMPHTIRTFLYMVDENMYNGGTFIISRSHILVGGPIDPFDEEGNKVLEDRMLEEGYYPNGVLLFKEYHPDYPHVAGTFGYNQQGGPIFFFNMKDNSIGHGPGYDGRDEGDPCFARVVEGWDVVERVAALRSNRGDDSLEAPVYVVDTQVVELQ